MKFTDTIIEIFVKIIIQTFDAVKKKAEPTQLAELRRPNRLTIDKSWMRPFEDIHARHKHYEAWGRPMWVPEEYILSQSGVLRGFQKVRGRALRLPRSKEHVLQPRFDQGVALGPVDYYGIALI